MSRIFVRNIPTKAKESDIEPIFGQAGKIEDVVMKTNFAFIQYETKTQAFEAIKLFNDYNMLGSKLSVELAKTRSEKLAERMNEKCFKCGSYGHWAKDCKTMKRQKRHEKRKFKKIRKSPERSFSRSLSNSSGSKSRSRSRSRSR
jgi:RNA recognition motif-containing protein